MPKGVYQRKPLSESHKAKIKSAMSMPGYKNRGQYKSGHIPWSKLNSEKMRRMNKHPMWKCGVQIHKNHIWISICDPLNSKTKRMPLHQIISILKIGRNLKPGEIVHHADGNPMNNHPNNLFVMSQSDHMELHQLIRSIEKSNKRMEILYGK